jgi:hypothetical protein
LSIGFFGKIHLLTFFKPTLAQDYQVKLMGDRDYAPLYRVLMRDESLLDFFKRILNYQGLAYFFDTSSEKTPLIISDAIHHFAPELEAKLTVFSPHALTLSPAIERIYLLDSYHLPQQIISTGAPLLEPNTLLAETQTVLTEKTLATTYHLNTNEQSDRNAATRAAIASLALQSEQTTAQPSGGDLIFAGVRLMLSDSNSWLIRTSTIKITFDEHDPERLGSIATGLFAQDAKIRYQAPPQFGEHASLMNGIQLGTPGTDKGSNLLSVNDQGHYHATLPDTISSNQEAHGVHVFDARMLHPMHSNDHSSHMTLPTQSEGVLFWSEGFSGEPLMLGTLNNRDNVHPTTSTNPQNAYWQDNDTNKLGFINEGTFKPYEKTGRNTAAIMETPGYDLNGNQSYVRLGDAIGNDTAYSSQAGEPGIFLNTSGNYQEEHQGGLVALAGNLNQNTQGDGFTPTLRHMVQIAPTLGTYHILDSSTAHVHNETLTSDNVTEQHQQDASTINKTLTAATYLKTYNADTTDNVYVNQSHQTSGDTTNAIYNEHTLTSKSTTTQILEMGDATSESHDTHTLNLNHNLNQYTSTTHEASINNQATQINTLTQNFTNYTGTVTTLNSNSATSNINANNATLGGNNFYQGGLLSISNNGSAANIPDMYLLNQQGISAIENEQAPNKKEIIFLLDCPENPPSLQLSVNDLNPQCINPNIPFIYSLTDEQKRGPINISTQTQSEQLQNILHPDIRKINLQYNCPAEAQMPEAYFNLEGQLPIYQGIMDLEAIYSMPNNMANLAYSLMCFENSIVPNSVKLGQSHIESWPDEAIDWLKEQLGQSIGDVNTWIINANGTDVDDMYGNISMATDKNNHLLIKGFMKTGILKVTQVGEKVIVSFPYTKQFKAYVSFFISSGGSAAAMAGQLEADKAGYFTKKGIYLIRLAKTFAKMTPSEQSNFNEKLANYKSLSGKDILTDLIIINIFDLIKKDMTQESLVNYLADLTLDNANYLLTIFMTIATDGVAKSLLSGRLMSLVIAKVFGQYFIVSAISNKIIDHEHTANLHEKIATSTIAKNAADFISKTYNNSQNTYIQTIFKKLGLMIEHGTILSE